MTIAMIVLLSLVALLALAQVITLVLFMLDPPVIHIDFTPLQRVLSHDQEDKA